MTRYAVELAEAALAAITAQARYIAVDQQQPTNAERWLRAVWDAVDSLEQFPRRCARAEENEDVAYEVRAMHVGGPALLFTIDDDRETVWVIALRGEGRLPDSRTLPKGLDDLEVERRREVLRKARAEGDRDEEAAALTALQELLERRLRNAREGGTTATTVEDILEQLRDEQDRDRDD